MDVSVTVPRVQAAALEFPGVGRTFLATFAEFRAELHFESPSSLTWTLVDEDGSRGRSENVAIRIEPIAGSTFIVSWQEANKTTVVAVHDFAGGRAFTHVTRLDGTFLRARGTLVERRR